MRRGDPWLIVLPLLLGMVGLVMVYSSSAILGITRYQDPNHFRVRQLVRTVVGVAAMWLAMRADFLALERCAAWFLGAAVALLAVVAAVGHVVKGASRWLKLGMLSI